MTEPVSYEGAVSRLEEIIRRLDSGEAGLRETLQLVAEGRELVEYCAAELDTVSRRLEGDRQLPLGQQLKVGQRAVVVKQRPLGCARGQRGHKPHPDAARERQGTEAFDQLNEALISLQQQLARQQRQAILLDCPTQLSHTAAVVE